jgi:ketosteroid isomerase-like protein
MPKTTEVVHKQLRARERSRRSLDQRLALRFPRLAAVAARLIGRLPPSSRLRQAALRRGALLAAAALNRRDVDAIMVFYDPDYEFRPAHEFVEGGFTPACYRGPAGYHEFVSDWSDVWGADLRVEPVEVIDLGTRVVTLFTVPTRARASGVPLTGNWAAVATLKNGRVIRDQVYLDHAEALEAVGLRAAEARPAPPDR